ncbi:MULTISPECIES: DEAD/DEAH box helicase family protein [unclassified Bradyrhizobium]|uniref:DEAD/DEAH box helicase family protein n=1 Tax=unclassified Bradyrhizobium TaxID=2631580 RepID=UPI002FF2DA01
MTRLQLFQRATVDAAVSALSTGSRRFLVADEVGLGKTIVARAVAERLKPSGHSLNIFYLCPSLEIAAQNRDKFAALTGLTRTEQSAGADRLSLSLWSPPPSGNGFRVLSLTPETSLPCWKPGARTGRKQERSLIWNLIRRGYPDLVRDLRMLESNRGAKTPLFEASSDDVSPLASSFDQALRAIFNCDGGHLEPEMRSWLEWTKDPLEFVARCRSALVLAALSRKRTSPDLLILDEFHRYADLIVPSRGNLSKKSASIEQQRAGKILADRQRVHKILIDALLNGNGGRSPAVLLLSATPYKLSRLDGSQINPGQRYGSLIELVKFLYGPEGDSLARRVTESISAYHRALASREEVDQAKQRILLAKRQLEAIFKPVIARTERALALTDDQFVRCALPTSIESADIEVFRHLATSVAAVKNDRLRSWTTPLWSSVPYPAQTLHGYGVWKALLRARRRPRITIENSRARPAHPQFRQLSNSVVDAKLLQLPWLKPSLPWWTLEGAWAENQSRNCGKVLLFSKFRAVPTAVSALLSLPIDEASIGSKLRGVKVKTQSYLRPNVGLNHGLLAMFAPWPSLSAAIEPKKDPALGISSIVRDAAKQLRVWIEQRGIEIKNGPSRPTWKVAVALEIGGNSQIARELTRSLRIPALLSTLDVWSKTPQITQISTIEIERLAEFLLSAPGPIVARSLARHGVALKVRENLDEKIVQKAFDFCWTKLRTYLGQRYFERAVVGRSRKRYPQSLMMALTKGGFEAVLDEQLALLRTLGDKKGSELIVELGNGLLDRPGLVRLRRRGSDSPVRVHAAAPFSGGERRGGGHDRKDEKLRSDTLRRAFNSPFWPHVLSTTSIGQEGLDFHYWCDMIVHWDLPVGPVEFEQREGRVSRYSSLTVRRAFVAQHSPSVYKAASRNSPFIELFERAHLAPDDGIGLQKWWTPASEKPTSITFNMDFSVRARRLKRLQDDLMFYRLGIGQPDPEAFINFLKHIDASPDIARGLALNLSPSMTESLSVRREVQ